ncbi:MAG: DUF2909 domain-containing protein [Gammaproteobacteria bacterium]|nr:DUF2909 domain-containing protein [Gammaproteobacteria bacterium]
MIKIVIIVLLAGVVLSLFGSLRFLFKDSDHPQSKRSLYTLGVRITLATALLLTVGYGFYSGALRMGNSAPWHQRSEDLLEDALKDIDEQKQAHPDHIDEVPIP